MATETYALASFVTSGGVVAASKLQAEISASAAIPIQITGVTVDVECRIDFQATLDAGQKSALDALVAAHTGVQEAQPPTLVDIAGPKESDGKQIVVISPATEGFKTWLTSRGDDVNLGAAGRGKGVRLAIEFDGTDPLPVTKTIESAWLDPMEVHDGQFNWTPAAFDHTDEFSVSVVMPGNVATPSPGVGNVNAIALGGGAELYIPAAGDGSHTILLSSAVPAPSSDKTGFWNVDDDGIVTPSASPGAAGWNLVNFEVEVFMIVGVSMLNSLGLFDVDVYKTEWLHQRWKVRLSITKASPGAGVASGWLLCFRRNPTRT